MDVKEHYESYREGVKRDLLPGATEFAKTLPTQDPKQYPTVYDFLSESSRVLKACVNLNDKRAYRSWLEGHQTATIGLLERFVASQGLSALDLIEQKGWRWFRFSKENVVCSKAGMVWVPRYPTTVQDPCFDAEELELMFQAKDGKFWNTILTAKREFGACKLITGQGRVPLSDLNASWVEDWTVRLFS